MQPFPLPDRRWITRFQSHWFWRVVFLPVAVTRLSQFLVIYFSQLFPFFQGPNPPVWDSRLVRLVSAWSGWDSGWYLSIIRDGYFSQGPVTTAQSNFAFYPVYPYLVKWISWPDYHFVPSELVLIAFGVLVSNLFLLGALYFFYKLVVLVFGDEHLAERSIVYILVFPAAFFFSCVYTESTFLFFALASFYYGVKKKWWMAGVMAVFTALARPLGVLIIVPLGILYLEALDWRLRHLKPDVLFLGLGPLALFLYMLILTPITGDLLAMFKIQAAWHKSLSGPIETIMSARWPEYSQRIYELDRISLLLFFALGVISLFHLPSISFGVFTLMIVTPIFFTGQLASVVRYCSVLFPAFILLAKYGKHPWVDKVVLSTFFTLQILFVAAWSRFYWVQ